MTEGEMQRRNTAFHEAGHAVAALYCGLPIRYVTMSGTSAYLKYGPPRFRASKSLVKVPCDTEEEVFEQRRRRQVRLLILVAFAGKAGELLSDTDCVDSDKDDQKLITRLAAWNLSPDQLEKLKDRANDIVWIDYPELVHEIAEELLSHGTVGGKRLREMWRAHTKLVARRRQEHRA